jgi:hypothetical protein
MNFPSFLFLNSSGVPNSFYNILILAGFSKDFGVSLYRTMHPSGSRLFGFLIPPVRRSRSREIPIFLEHLPCSFEPDPLSGKPDPENLRYQAVSKQNNDRLDGLTSASMAHGVGNKDVEKDQGGGTEAQSGFLGQPAPTLVLRPSSVFLNKTVGSHQRPPDLSGCNKRPETVYGLGHNGPRSHSFG